MTEAAPTCYVITTYTGTGQFWVRECRKSGDVLLKDMDIICAVDTLAAARKRIPDGFSRSAFTVDYESEEMPVELWLKGPPRTFANSHIELQRAPSSTTNIPI